MFRAIRKQASSNRTFRAFGRWGEVQTILVKYGFDFLIERDELKTIREVLSKNLHLISPEYSKLTPPQRVRMMLEELGPTYVKLGQMLSSRSDLLPIDWITELSKLQDSLPSFPFETVREIVQQELGRPLEEVYLEFDPQPLAAASIGQVHHAVLTNLNHVVVKVQRPNIRQQVMSDMEIIRQIARQAEAHTSWGKRYNVTKILEEFSRSLILELDYRNEASNAMRLRRLMESEPKIHIPYIYWDLTSERVLTMEQIIGIKVNNLEVLDENHINRKEVANTFINSLIKQLLIDGFFHADPHPGNLMVEPDLGTLVYIDLGMMGRLLPDQCRFLGDLVSAIFRRDSNDVTRLLIDIGTPYEIVDDAALRRDIDYIINRYLESSLKQISVASLLAELMTSVMKHGLRLPSEMTLAFKTIMQGEQIARTLDENISILDVIKSATERLIWQSLSPGNQADRLRDGIREFNRLVDIVPGAVETILKQVTSGKLTIAIEIPMFARIVNTLFIVFNRLVAALIVVGMMMASALFMRTAGDAGYDFLRIVGLVGFLASGVAGAILVWGVLVNIITSSRDRRKDRF
jgi:ubiquinone biosynthesis protein